MFKTARLHAAHVSSNNMGQSQHLVDRRYHYNKNRYKQIGAGWASEIINCNMINTFYYTNGYIMLLLLQ